jgi:hypothetical protein
MGKSKVFQMGVLVLATVASVPAFAGNTQQPNTNVGYRSGNQSKQGPTNTLTNNLKTAPDPALPWVGNADYNECGVKCIYLESVEKISIKTNHTLQTLQDMQAINPVGDETKKDDQTKKDVASTHAQMEAIIPKVCDWDGGETVKECQERWFKYQIPQLIADKVSIKMNDSAAGDLVNGKVGVKTTPGAEEPNPEPTGKPERQVPKIVRYSDGTDNGPKKPVVTAMEQYNTINARALKEADTNRKFKTPAALERELQNLTQVYPEEFYLTREILKDPQDPKAGTYTVVVTNPDGTPKLDAAAYNAAKATRIKQLGLTDKELARFEKNMKDVPGIQKAQLTTQRVKNEEIYNKVRANILGTARKALTKFGMLSPTQKGPTPASATPATTTASKKTDPAKQVGLPNQKIVKDQGTGVSQDIARVPTSTKDDGKDIDIPAGSGPETKPYVTVGYSDNVLGTEINEMQTHLDTLEGH